MSLLVFGSASRVAQGLIRQLHASGKYEKIVCADIYATYFGIQRHTQFLGTLDGVSSSTKICDTKITERSDLHHAISKSSHLLYVTHDYYDNCASKLNLIKQTAKIANELGHLKGSVAVTPVELNNYGEQDPSNAADASETEAQQLFPKLNLLKSDLTFGRDSSVLSRITARLLRGDAITFKPSGGAPAPVHTEDLAFAVEKLLDGQEGGKYLARGENTSDWGQIIAKLEGFSQALVQTNSVEGMISPLSNNMLSEFLYCRDYMNTVQFINKYQVPGQNGLKNASELGVNFRSFADWKEFDTQELRCGKSCLERMAMHRFY